MRKLCQCLLAITVAAAVGCVSGCRKADQPGGVPSVQFSTDVSFEDIPVPAGFTLKRKDSYSFQNDMVRVGRLVYTGRSGVNNVLAFYQQQMPLHGWQEMSYIDFRSSVRYYEKAGQSCILTVQPRKAWRNVEIVLDTRPKAR
ncbi:MAG: hypothetical protein PHN82_05045 [bacterium]|nr:hypothetical protein [bacterium]